MVLERQPILSWQPKLGRERLTLTGQLELSSLDLDSGRKNDSPTAACAVRTVHSSVLKLGQDCRGHEVHGCHGRQSSEQRAWQELRLTCKCARAVRRQPTMKRLGARP
jgi:hypothetical protein